MTASRPSAQDIDATAAALVPLLPALNRAMERHVRETLPYPPLPEGQLALLRLVAEQPGVTVREAASALLVKPNNASALVSQLVGHGLLERRADGGDRRVAHLLPTPLMLERLAEVEGLKRAFLAQALRALSDGEQAALGSATGALAALAASLPALRG
ncbi:MarR family winged helix-turn-helix transcriptional regulator [Actinomadura parmotrematis]|uniref:MarR family transcriptional regulator n=1 Tax=Actinomadura parmotrematis TaxID=2864039 RepID=A0ABS7FSS8_9ACTN|nr:MarR family transcriptional regulator [Actinomadura parmotrematis]MBW8483467.1 MarR family transcriptional regulator [Actinomadura parmotrematis]